MKDTANQEDGSSRLSGFCGLGQMLDDVGQIEHEDGETSDDDQHGSDAVQ